MNDQKTYDVPNLKSSRLRYKFEAVIIRDNAVETSTASYLPLDNVAETSMASYLPLENVAETSTASYPPLDNAVETSRRLDVKKSYPIKSREPSNEVVYHLPHLSYFFQID